jgi:carbamoyltransferase
MITWGINALNHDASIAVLEHTDLKFFRRASEYSGLPGDDRLNSEIIKDAISASGYRGPSNIAWYERPLLKKTRQLYAGQYGQAFDWSLMPKRYLKSLNLGYAKVEYMDHHKSHAAAGFFTSPFDTAAVVVVDAIGEWESASIWRGEGTKLTKIWSANYPNSLGVFYSAFTQLLGYKPLAEEHLLQQDSDRGDPEVFYKQVSEYFESPMQLRTNLHTGVYDWPTEINEQTKYDIAAAVQRVFEEQSNWINTLAQLSCGSENIVYMGGCAMNSKYNAKMVDYWKGVWSLPVPGDASSAIGAALMSANTRVDWKGPMAKHIEIKVKR